MKLIHNLTDEFTPARQPQEGLSTQTVADYVVRDDVVDGHQHIHGRKRDCPVCSSQEKRKICKMLKRTCQKGKPPQTDVMAFDSRPANVRKVTASEVNIFRLLCRAFCRIEDDFSRLFLSFLPFKNGIAPDAL